MIISGILKKLLPCLAQSSLEPEKPDQIPCIPDFIKNGKFRGLRAKGGVTVNGEWQDGKLTEAVITASADGILRLSDGREFAVALKWAKLKHDSEHSS